MIVTAAIACTGDAVPTPAPSTARPTPLPSPTREADAPRGQLYLVWSPGGFAPNAERRLEAIGGETEATTLVTGVKWLEDASAGPVPPAGYAFPVDVAYVEPREYERVLGRRGLLRKLAPDAVVVGDSGQRPSVTGLSVRLDGTSYTVGNAISDEDLQGYEMFLAGPAPPGWGASFLLARSRANLATLRARARSLSDRPVALVEDADTPYLRYAHSTTPYVFFKEHLGEFAARPSSDGSIEIEPGWVGKNIVDRDVPLIGSVRCHRKFVAQLRVVLTAVQSGGLGRSIDPEGFAGCYSPRFIGNDPGGRLSAHAWGAAVDLNAVDNPFGTEPTMDPKVVRLFERAGFNWGGRWLIPDGMHFEWAAKRGA